MAARLRGRRFGRERFDLFARLRRAAPRRTQRAAVPSPVRRTGRATSIRATIRLPILQRSSTPSPALAARSPPVGPLLAVSMLVMVLPPPLDTVAVTLDLSPVTPDLLRRRGRDVAAGAGDRGDRPRRRRRTAGAMALVGGFAAHRRWRVGESAAFTGVVDLDQRPVQIVGTPACRA